MKKKFFCSLAVCSVCMTAVIFTGVIEATEETKKSEVIVELVTKRAEAMSRYFAGVAEYSLAEELLRDIESGELLADDLLNLSAYTNTDIDQILYCQVTEVLITDEDEFYITADVTVEWMTCGLDGTGVMDVTYAVVCEKQGNTLKLVGFF